MRREAVIVLECQKRKDGSVYISSPDVPLFHVVATRNAEVVPTVLPVLKEHLERRFGCSVELRPAETVDDLCTKPRTKPRKISTPPAHIIAEMAAQ